MVRASLANRRVVSTKALEDGDSSDREPSVQRKVGFGPRQCGRVSATDLGERVSIEQNWRRLHGASGLGFFELVDESSGFESRDVSQTGGGQREDVVGTGSDVNVLAVVPSEQSEDLSLEATAAAFCVESEAIAKRGGETNGPCDGGFLSGG